MNRSVASVVSTFGASHHWQTVRLVAFDRLVFNIPFVCEIFHTLRLCVFLRSWFQFKTNSIFKIQPATIPTGLHHSAQGWPRQRTTLGLDSNYFQPQRG